MTAATAAPPIPTTDRDLIGQCWAALVCAGDVHESRMPDTRKGPLRLFGVASGYFDDPDAFVAATSRISGADAVAVYVTLNPVNPALLARAANRIRDGKPTTTGDADILRRRNALLDFDPVRPADIGATDEERDEAVRSRDRAERCLRDEFGWPDPVMSTMSGNGGGLVYRIDLPNDAASADLVRRVVQGAAVLFGTERVAVDTTTYNASRITKVTGTVSAKGDHMPDRPWRLATATFNPEPSVVSREHLAAIAAFAPKPEPRATPSSNGHAAGRTWDIRDVLAKKGIGFTKKELAYATAFGLDRCLTSTDHVAGAVILEFPNGALAYSCRHNRCQGKGWQDVRPLLDLPERDASTEAKSGAAQSGSPAAGHDGTRRRFNAQDERPETTAAAWGALAAVNTPPRMFVHNGTPMRLDRTEAGEPILRELGEDRLRHEVARAADWYKRVKPRGQEATVEVPARPHRDLVKDMLACPEVPLPPLDRLVRVPVFGPDGALQTEPGYHAASRTYYDPAPGFVLPPVPMRPSGTDVARARSLVRDDLLADFPFVGAADRAHAVGEFLLPFVRAMVDGATPIHVHEAPRPRTGKDLLAEAMALVAVGHLPMTMAYSRNGEEVRKRLTAVLLLLPQWLVIPNVVHLINSPELCDAVTRCEVRDRILGATETVHVAARCVWTVTANNPVMSREAAQRSVRIRLDAGVENPGERPASGFRHPNLRQWTHEHRADLVWAALTLLRSWLAAGAPKSTAVMGGFESWAATIGGILGHLGVPGFLGNITEFYAHADGESAPWAALVAEWWDRFEDDKVTSAQLFPLTEGIVGFDFGKGSDRSQQTAFGMQLGRQRDVIYNGKQISAAGERNRAALWRLVTVESRRGTYEPNEPDEPFSSAHARDEEPDVRAYGTGGKGSEGSEGSYDDDEGVPV
jgi:hypothetical protein